MLLKIPEKDKLFGTIEESSIGETIDSPKRKPNFDYLAQNLVKYKQIGNS